MTSIGDGSTAHPSHKSNNGFHLKEGVFPIRNAVLTYLPHLDRHWHGGWSWQWPMVIAGLKDSGKTLFTYQLLASALLSYPSPWRIAYADCRGDYQPEQILRVLRYRLQNHPRRNHLGRIDKMTSFHSEDLLNFAKLQLSSTHTALWIIEGLDQLNPSTSLTAFLTRLAEINRRKRIGIIVTIRGMIDDLRPLIPWNEVPFFLFFSKLRPRLHRLRVWQNGVHHLVYDRKLVLKVYFQEAQYRVPLSNQE